MMNNLLFSCFFIINMPSHNLHNLIAKIIFPWIDEKKIKKINRLIDEPYKILKSRHRELFHKKDITTLLFLLKYGKDPDVIPLWLLHVYLDYDRDKFWKDLDKVMKLWLKRKK